MVGREETYFSLSPCQKESRSRTRTTARGTRPVWHHHLGTLSSVCPPHRHQPMRSHSRKKGFHQRSWDSSLKAVMSTEARNQAAVLWVRRRASKHSAACKASRADRPPRDAGVGTARSSQPRQHVCPGTGSAFGEATGNVAASSYGHQIKAYPPDYT